MKENKPDMDNEKFGTFEKVKEQMKDEKFWEKSAGNSARKRAGINLSCSFYFFFFFFSLRNGKGRTTGHRDNLDVKIATMIKILYTDSTEGRNIKR